MTSVTASIADKEQVGHADQPLLQYLRQATYSSHHQIEQNTRLARLLQPNLTLVNYQEVLARMLGFLEPLEQAIDASPEASRIYAGLGKRSKTPWLIQDLLSLGHSVQSIADIPRATPQELPAVTSLAKSAGVLYVLEGSTLGGQLISRHLNHNLGLTSDRGGRFYAGYGAENGRMWGQFRHWLNSLSLEESQVHQAARAAVRTFEGLDLWLSREIATDG